MVDLQEVSEKKKSRGLGSWFSGLTKWQTLLAVLPLTLVGVGGLIGGAIGAVAAVVNVKLARTGLATAPKALVMVLVDVVAVVVYFVLAALVLNF